MLNRIVSHLLTALVIAFLMTPAGCRQDSEAVRPIPFRLRIRASQPSIDGFWELNEQLLRDSLNPGLLFERAQLMKIRGNIPGAYQEMERVVTLDSGKADYFLALADIAFRALQVPRSIEAFGTLPEDRPEEYRSALAPGRVVFLPEGLSQAIESANNALRLNDRLARAYSIKGFVYKESGDTAKAISSFQTVLELDPENHDTQRELGRIFAAKGSPGVAVL